MVGLLSAMFLSQIPLERAHIVVPCLAGGRIVLYSIERQDLSPQAPSVLLISDVGFGRALFDSFDEGLASFLAQRGFRVFIAEMRGQGNASQSLGLSSIKSDFEALESALISRIQNQPYFLVTHGWLGSMAAAFLTHVKAMVAISMPARAEMPSRLMQEFLALHMPFAKYLVDDDARNILFMLSKQIPIHQLRALQSSATRAEQPQMSIDLYSLMSAGDFIFDDGSSWKQRLSEFTVPTLMMNAVGDEFAPAEMCTPFREISKGSVELKFFTQFDGGDDFSHLGLLSGKSAEKLVFPLIEQFFRKLQK